MICKYFSHSFQRVSIVFVLTAAHYQADYLIFRKWPIQLDKYTLFQDGRNFSILFGPSGLVQYSFEFYVFTKSGGHFEIRMHSRNEINFIILTICTGHQVRPNAV